ncbi:putative D-lactate dehydrogenase [Smittium culicis]|uniref:Putative D-lactate dehydrogenase n=1 Tax=Smittium culicis TaxID=133412 RepID=A0A1R1Y7P5_9FUNG|nr:putative D-lactate dehydrogenase [Smittium culicis]
MLKLSCFLHSRTSFSRSGSTFSALKKIQVYKTNDFNPICNFSSISREDVLFFTEILGSENIMASKALGGSYDIAEFAKYNESWQGEYTGKSQLIVFPKSTQNVSDTLKYCNSNKIAVVPQGGNSGVQGIKYYFLTI